MRSNSDPQQLRLRVTWLTAFRLLATTLLLLILLARVMSRSEPVSGRETSLFVFIGFVYAFGLLFSLLLRFGRIDFRAAWGQIVADVALSTTLVLSSGGIESPFAFAYSISIIIASVLLLRRGALFAAVLSTLCYLGVLWFGHRDSEVGLRMLIEVSIQVTANFLIAFLSGFVAEQLSATGGQLSLRERDLAQLTDLQNRIVSAMPSGLLTCEQDGTVTYVNPAGEQMLGLVTSIRGRPVEDYLPGVGRVPAGTWRHELKAPTPTGEKTLGLTVASLEAAAGSVLIVFQDLTELRRLETELERIDTLANLGKISAQLAHEIRNPLASMRGSAQMLAEDAAKDSVQEKMARLVVRESDRLAALVEEYLRLARPPPPTLALTKLDELVLETVDMLKHDPRTASVLIETQLSPSSALVDASQVKQVLINLLRNAVNAVEAKDGTIKVLLSAEKPADAVTLEVWDSAGSIREEHLERIFEPFFSTSQGGTGLGLSTSKAIVQSHGAQFSVRSNPTEGTTFAIRFRASSP